MFVGRSQILPSYLASRVNGTCGAAGAGCLDSYFVAAYNCYKGYSADYAGRTPNAVASEQYGGLLLTCNSALYREYVVNVDVALFNSITYYTLNGCNFQARWVLNIIGTGTVNFTGGSFPSVSGAIVYNVIGSRNIYVSSTGVNGHILAVDSVLTQISSVIVGKVIVGNYLYAIQTNRFICAKPGSVILTTTTSADTPADSSVIKVVGNQFVVGDSIQFNGATYTVVGVSTDSINVIPNIPNAAPAGTTIIITVADPAQSRTDLQDGPMASGQPIFATTMENQPDSTSSASVFTIIFAFVVILAMF